MSGLMVQKHAPQQALERLQAAAAHAHSAGPQSIQLGDLSLNYVDAPSLYTAYKNIFVDRIYHLTQSSDAPVLIDGGAHIGLAAMYWKRQFPGAKITCFEPDETALSLLRQNLSSNGFDDVTIVAAGLSDQDGTAAFQGDGADGGRIEAPDAAINSQSAGTVRTIRLSKHLTGPVDLLKLNIEGQEWLVLRELEQSGRIGLIRRMVIEYHGWPGGRQSLGDLLNLLDRCSYRYLIHDFDRETNPATKPPFRIRAETPWFCLVYAEQITAMDGVTKQEDSCKQIDWGELRRVTPVSRVFGLDRGTPVDRYYIERFLAHQASDICGHVLEIGDATYTRRFGGQQVSRSDVLHAVEGHRAATIIGDLSSGAGIPPCTFDCILLTQTLHVIEDYRSAIVNAARALKHGGVLLATLPGISQISRYDMERWGDWWRFTSRSAHRLFADVFGEGRVEINIFGNVLATTAFLQGISAEELRPEELDHFDRDYELVLAFRAIKGNPS